MTDRTVAMKRAKHAVNDAKFDRVRAVIAQIKDQGRDDDLKASIIARRAGVHRSFVSNHFNAQITHAKSEIQARFISGLTSNTRAERRIATGRDGNRKATSTGSPAGDPRTEGPARSGARRRGRRRYPEHGTSSTTVKALQNEVEQLLAAQAELRRHLRNTEEELDAARRLNRTLMRERNIKPSETRA